MDNEPRGADDLPDEAELSGPVRDAIEQIRREEPCGRRARPRAGAGAADRRPRRSSRLRHRPPSDRQPFLPRGDIACLRSHFAVWPQPPPPPALIGAWLYNQVSSTAAADLGAVLTRTSAAKSLELKVTQDGKTGRGLGPRPEAPPQPARRHLPDRPRRQIVARRREGESGQRATGIAVPRRGRRRGPVGLARSSRGPPRRQAEGIAGGPAGRARDPRRPRGGNLSLGDRRTGWHAADRGRGRCQDPIAPVDRKPAGPRRADRADLQAGRHRPRQAGQRRPVRRGRYAHRRRPHRQGDRRPRAGGHSARDARSLEPGDRADAAPPRRLAADRSPRGQRRVASAWFRRPNW